MKYMFFNRFYILAFIGTLMCSTLFIVLYNNKQHTARNYHYRIAMLVPATHPSMDQIMQGFTTTIQQLVPNTKIDTFNANGDKMLLKAQSQKIALSNYDAIFTIGATASQMTHTFLKKEQSITPLIIAAVADPFALGLTLQDGTHPGVTGITDHYDRNDQINRLLSLIPVQHPLLIYAPEGKSAIEKEVNDCKQAFAQHNIILTTLPIYHLSEIQPKLIPLLHKHDLVMTLTDHTICSVMDTLIKLCNQHHVPLYTSELDSNKKGATFSYGVHERDYGVLGAQLAHGLIIDKTPITQLPIISMQPFYFLINKHALTYQRITLSQHQLDQYSNHEKPL